MSFNYLLCFQIKTSSFLVFAMGTVTTKDHLVTEIKFKKSLTYKHEKLVTRKGENYFQ